MRGNLNLTREEYYKLVQNLKNGDEKLFEITFKNLVLKGIRYLKSKFKNVDNSLIEDAAIETLLILRKKIKEDKIEYGGINSLYYLMLSQEFVRMKKFEDKSVSIQSISVTEFGDNDKDENEEESENFFGPYKKEIVEKLKVSFVQLDKDCKKVLTYIYSKNYNTKLIAKKIRISEDAVRKRKQRCLSKLKNLLANN